MVLKRIGVLSAAKVSGALYAAFGLLAGLFFGAIFSLIPMGAQNSEIPAWLAPMFGLGAVVVMPIMYGVMGFVGGAIGAFLYNIFAGAVGGIELDLEVTKQA